MRQHGFRELFVKVRDRRQYLGAAHRMRGDFMALFRCQLALLVHDVEQRFVNLAYVVKERAQFDRTPRLLVHTDHVGEDERVTRDAAAEAGVSPIGARRWQQGHPWIYRSDVTQRPSAPAGVVRVRDARGKAIGLALWSPRSEISLRLLDSDPSARIDARWWHDKIAASVARRAPIAADANSYRLVYGEGDALPSLICDKYDRWVVLQLMSAGLESQRNEIVAAVESVVHPLGVLARNDV